MVESGRYESVLKQLGVPSFRPGQQDVIERVLQGKSTLVLMPTGSGKSLCYQLPALLLSGVTLVISPLLALMKDQVDDLVSHGVSAARWDSTVSDEERVYIVEQAQKGNLKLLYTSPESLQSKVFLSILPQIKWSVLVIDEAHCLSEWGQRFRPEYLRLPRFSRQMSLPVLALTATATVPVVQELCQAFSIKSENVVRLPLRKNNIEREICPCKSLEKNKILTAYLNKSMHLPALVYVNRREDAEQVAAVLQRAGIEACAYHAGLPSDVRVSLQEEYLKDKISVMVATIAFGMGVDKSNVRSVVHYHIPQGLEGYLQESGRAGRDGQKAYSLILSDADDFVLLKNRLLALAPTVNSLDSFLRMLLPRGISPHTLLSFSAWDTSGLYDLDDFLLSRILTDLEERGILIWKGMGKKKWKCRLQRRGCLVGMGCSAEEAQFLSWIAEKKEVTLDEVCEYLSVDYIEAQDCMESLSLSGDWIITNSHILQFYTVTHVPESYRSEALYYSHLFDQRRRGDLERLTLVKKYLESSVCLNQVLEQYFGEVPSEPCGHCSVCLYGQRLLSPASEEPSWIDEDYNFVKELTEKKYAVLSTPLNLARYLAGFLSPSASQARLWKLPQYGAYRNYSIETLEYYAQTLL